MGPARSGRRPVDQVVRLWEPAPERFQRAEVLRQHEVVCNVKKEAARIRDFRGCCRCGVLGMVQQLQGVVLLDGHRDRVGTSRVSRD